MKRAKNSGFIILVMMMSFALLLAGCGDGADSGPGPGDFPVGGTGTLKDDWYNNLDDTFTINNADELAGLARIVNDGEDDFYGKTIILSVNLELSAYSGGEGWIPIGNSTHEFWGTFDGDYKTISGLVINTTDANVGLFGKVGDDATIKNLGVIGADIKGGTFVGSIVGYAGNCAFSNCYATGEVRGDGFIGGLIGNLLAGEVSGSFSTCKVSSVGNYAGGLVGFDNTSSSINNCYATGAVDGILYVGGLTGGGDSGRVTMCYATGEVSANRHAGGLAGYFQGGKIEFSVALNLAINRTGGSYNDFGRVVGFVSSGTVLNPNGNLALDGMDLPSGVSTTAGEFTRNGADFPKNLITDQSQYSEGFSEGFGWSFNAGSGQWKMGNAAYPLPVLYWQTEASYPVLPEHLK